MKIGMREIVFMILLILIPPGTWWFVFRPQNTRNVEMHKWIENRQAKLGQLNRTLSTMGDLEKQIASLSNAVKYFQSKLPDEKEMDKILKEIWLLAESNDLRARSIRTRNRRSNVSFLTLDSEQAEQSIVIQLQGDFMGFYSFLLALENQPRIMRIVRMAIKKPLKCPEGHISAEFEMSIFFERNPKVRKWPQKTST